MAKSRLLSCAAQERKKTDELPVLFLAGTQTRWMTCLATMFREKQRPWPTLRLKKQVQIFVRRAAEAPICIFLGSLGTSACACHPRPKLSLLNFILSKIVQTFVPGKVCTSSCNEKFTPPVATKCPHCEPPRKIHTHSRHEKSIGSAATKSPHT